MLLATITSALLHGLTTFTVRSTKAWKKRGMHNFKVSAGDVCCEHGQSETENVGV